MHRTPLLVVTALLMAALGAAVSLQEDAPVKTVEQMKGLPARIAFGSCASQEKPQPVLQTVVSKKPELFIYLGDNIYADTRDMKVLQAKYAKLAAKPEFQELRKNVAVLATWDDHDYGENDAGKEYPMKEQSRAIFLDFWKVPGDSPRRQHAGIYGEHRFTDKGRVLQVILLDTRTFRDPLKRNSRPLPAGSPFKNDYQPDENPEKTLLGEGQWKWLKERLSEPADVRIICSSIQFSHEYNGYESWTNLPAEQQKMIDLIKQTRASGVVFISGDVHWAEISRRDLAGGYPLYDVTASGITETWPTVEPNRYRQGDVVRDNHFGMIDIDWGKADPELVLQIVDRSDKVRISQATSLSKLRFP
jgi:alkaline phosphatase D